MEYLEPYEMRILEVNSTYLGITLNTLMENAGRASYEELKKRFDLNKNQFSIFCGTGNNGGDGFVLARLLSNHREVNVFLLGEPENIQKIEAKTNWEILKNLHYRVKIFIIKDKENLKKVNDVIKNSDILVDAILGTGIKGKLREPIASAINLINSEIKPKISLDVPSGLDPLTGEVHDKAVLPNLTITFHKPKKGLISDKNKIGELIAVPISIPEEAGLIVGPGDVIAATKLRKIDSKKGDFGKLLVIGGSDKYHGAPLFSALAAIRTGIDLVIIAAPEYLANTIRSYSPNLIVRDYPGKYLSPMSLPFILDLIDWADSIVIGPGLGTEVKTKEATVELFRIIKESKKPLLIDADAIKTLSENKDLMVGSKTVVTPHRGEFKILTGISILNTEEIKDKEEIIKNKINEYDLTFVVKGAIDLIAHKNQLKFNYTGNPGMTVGGTGDVLTGIIGCLLAQKNDPFLAASAGAFINGLAGDLLNRKVGYHFTSSELIDYIPLAIEECLLPPEKNCLRLPKTKIL